MLSIGLKSVSWTRSSVILFLFIIALIWRIFVYGFDFKNKCANSISCIKDISGIFQIGKKNIFLSRSITSLPYVSNKNNIHTVLGNTTSIGEKHIFIDLDTQQLYAYEDKIQVYAFPVSTGKWGKTPTGTFRIWIKIRNAHMEGGSGDDYYNLYNVPYTMFFSNENVDASLGFSIHGAYWHNNFGYPMSHGCINLRPEDAEKIYGWADPPTRGISTHSTTKNKGTLITIYGEPHMN
ncbi:hypothetical protein LBMAG33_2050 [Candidatus Levyibacteriota bacterium]|nr:murein L,D-transpeptidase [Candidatus Levybacteria bacterium]GDX61895.1 hypothetical protein LBMAG33_2050 [Candidatus Levybacteria bacterium]